MPDYTESRSSAPMACQFFGHAVPSPHTSQSAQQDVAQLPLWGPVSPLRIGSPWGQQSSLGVGSPLRIASPWMSMRTPSPAGVSVSFSLHESTGNLDPFNAQNISPQQQQSINWRSWRTPSPSGMSVSFSLRESSGNPNLYNPYNDFPQPQQSNNSGSATVHPQLLNLHNTPSGSFVAPSIENIASRQLRTVTPANRLSPIVPVEENLPAANSTRSRFSDEEWEKHHSQIRKLWLDEDKSLEETKQAMIQEYNFDPS